MASFIKSHSNYVLKSKHQTINDGTIWERDITTIGGLNQFAPGQTPIYQSGNFIITVRDDRRETNQYNTSKWEKGTNGDVWTLETVDEIASKNDAENDTKIVLKKDYYDFRDFAYYGSLTELFRSSITDILNRFPGELFFSGEESYYTYSHTVDGELVEETYQIGKKLVLDRESGECVVKEVPDPDDDGNEYLYEIKNPFGINMHSQKRPIDGDILKYFADGGISNYEIVNPCETQKCNFNIIIDKIILICVPVCTEDCGCFDISGITIDNDDKCGCETGILEFDVSEGCDCNSITMDIQQNATRSLRKSISRETTISGDENSDEEQTEEDICLGEDCSKAPIDIKIRVYVETNGKIHYMYSRPSKDDDSDEDTSENSSESQNEDVETCDLTGYHLRPREEFLIKFYNESNEFEKYILNYDATPRYKSTFSVIHENEYGYYRNFEEFIFPTSEGGYNPSTDESFISNLIDIGEFYDDRFTDNLWRSMTHEAIKNFDWTHTREYEEGDELEFVAGGKKIQKALRIFAREFDEIKSYIDNIRFMNRITYDERNNLPDYFLADDCELSGWDIKYVMPYDIEERYITGDNVGELVDENIVYYNGEDIEKKKTAILSQLSNAISSTTQIEGEEPTTVLTYFSREYSQDRNKSVIPYTKANIKDGSENGYFLDCTDGGKCDFTCWLNDIYGNDSNCKIRIAKEIEHSEYESEAEKCVTNYENLSILKRKDGTSRIMNRIKPYTDETEYSYMKLNNEFLRRLSLNSKYIWRHKGTIEGIEMILGMFGLKSKRWLDNMDSIRYKQAADRCNPDSCEVVPDYEIREYTSFAKRIEEEWDVENQMYRIDWVNTTKTITYDYRSQSNYTLPGSVGYTGIPYQGIPVSYREEYDGYADDKKYIKIPVEGSTDYYIDDKGNKIYKRYLYPYFNKSEQLDGNPYFQMDGGWLSKRISGTYTDGEGETPTTKNASYNFQFDVDNNIVYNKYVPIGSVTENGFIDDNHALYKETVRSIKRVDTLSDLVSVPQNILHDGSIYYVGKIGSDVAVVNGEVFDITHHGNDRFITYVRRGGFITIGDKYFDETIVVYDKNLEPTTYYIDDKLDGYEIKAYIKNVPVTNEGEGEPSRYEDDFITYNSENPDYTITSFQVISEDEYATSDIAYTNYYILDDVSFSDSLASPGEKNGWRRLKENDYEYLRINTITNYYGGNNGHNGNMVYDSGHEYFTYFNRIFKYAYDNDMFDSRCYTDGFDWLGGEVFDYGFSGLIESNEEIKQYDRFLLNDDKIHYFGNFKENLTQVCEDISAEGETEPEECNKNNGNFIRKITIYGDYHRYAVQDSKNPMTDEKVKEAAKLSIARSLNLAKKEENEETGESEWKIVDGIDIDFITSVTGLTTYNEENLNKIGVTDMSGIDDVTNQIVNNKRLKIIFNMKYSFNSRNGQCELKYIDDVVMNYLTHLVPSTAIFDVEYSYCEFNYDGC